MKLEADANQRWVPMDVNEAVPNVRKTTTEMRVQSRQLEQVPHRRYKKKIKIKTV